MKKPPTPPPGLWTEEDWGVKKRRQHKGWNRWSDRPPSMPFPPWIRDESPQNWVQVVVAARGYFHKHLQTVKNYILSGELEKQGIPSYWDGHRWWVRLPTLIGPHTLKPPSQPKDFKVIERQRHLARYGLTIESYDAMAEEQGGCCAICGKTPPLLHVDRDHKTGLVRGLLCFGCNGALGTFRDDPELLKKAWTYLVAARNANSAKSA